MSLGRIPAPNVAGPVGPTGAIGDTGPAITGATGSTGPTGAAIVARNSITGTTYALVIGDAFDLIEVDASAIADLGSFGVAFFLGNAEFQETVTCRFVCSAIWQYDVSKLEGYFSICCHGSVYNVTCTKYLESVPV